jgi:methylmalonyl-CoA mutase cobalamin-binding subunit
VSEQYWVYVADGRRVRTFLANLGPIPQHKPRADFSRGFFEVAGFEVLSIRSQQCGTRKMRPTVLRQEEKHN